MNNILNNESFVGLTNRGKIKYRMQWHELCWSPQRSPRSLIHKMDFLNNAMPQIHQPSRLHVQHFVLPGQGRRLIYQSLKRMISEGSRRFHNHGEGPYYLLFVLVVSAICCFLVFYPFYLHPEFLTFFMFNPPTTSPTVINY